MPAQPSSWLDRLRTRTRYAVRWMRPVVRGPLFWLGLVGFLGGLFALYALWNGVLMPLYTRQHAVVVVPEVRNLPFEEAMRLLQSRNLRPERRDQPFDPSRRQGVVVDQNPSPNVQVKPGRRVYLYVNTGTERTVQMPELRTFSESEAVAQLRQLGIFNVEVRQDDAYSPHAGTVTRQRPDPGTTVRTGETVVLWTSPGLGTEEVSVPDVRGRSPADAMAVLRAAGLWVDPTLRITGTITSQSPAPGSLVRMGTEARLSSAPLEEPVSPPDEEEILEGFGEEEPVEPAPEPAPPPPRSDW